MRTTQAIHIKILKEQPVPVREGLPLRRRPWQLIAIVLIPLTLPLTFRWVGQVLVAELLLLGCLPTLLSGQRTLGKRLPKIFFILAGIWLAGQLVTDIIRHSAAADLMRGWAGILFFATDFLAIYALIDGRRRRLAIFALALGVGGILKALIAPADRLAGFPLSVTWKYGMGQSVSLLALVLPFLFPRLRVARVAGLIAPFLLAPIHLLLDARSLAGIVAGAGVATFSARLLRIRRLSLKPILVISCIAITASWAVGRAYESLAAGGYLGASAVAKYQKQTKGSLNLLLAGRSDLLGSIPAILDSPILGHGSWARDIRYELIRLAALDEAGYDIGFIDDRIPTHSALFGAWVQAGLLGAVFWLWALSVALRAGFRVFLWPGWLPLAAYMIAALIWDTLFSPCAMEQRILSSLYLTCAMLLLENGPNPAQIHAPSQACA